MSTVNAPAWSRLTALAGALLCIAMPARAQVPEPEAADTVFSLAGLYDEDGTYSVNAGLDHAFGEATWLRLTAGLADGATGPVSLSTYRAGLGLDHWFDPAGLAVDVEYWGDSDTIETLTYRGELYFRGEHARFGLNAAFRDIDLTYQVPCWRGTWSRTASRSRPPVSVPASAIHGRQCRSMPRRLNGTTTSPSAPS